MEDLGLRRHRRSFGENPFQFSYGSDLIVHSALRYREVSEKLPGDHSLKLRSDSSNYWGGLHTIH